MAIAFVILVESVVLVSVVLVVECISFIFLAKEMSAVLQTVRRDFFQCYKKQLFRSSLVLYADIISRGNAGLLLTYVPYQPCPVLP